MKKKLLLFFAISMGYSTMTLAQTPPVNDVCGSAVSVSPGAAVATGSTTFATNVEALPACNGGGGGDPGCIGGTGTVDFGAGVWFIYSSTSAESITVTTDGSNFNTELQVFKGICGALTCIGGDDNGAGVNASSFCWASTASENYYIYLDGHGTATGNYVINLGTAALPVTLVSFGGEAMPRSNKLTWKTATEQNTEMHIIERSATGMDWETVGELPAAGFSNETLSYELFDRAPLMKSYYRLKSVDYDGYTDYSKVITIQRDQVTEDAIAVFPNPFTDEINVNMSLAQEVGVKMEVFSTNGKLLKQQQFSGVAGNNSFYINADQFHSGLYYVMIQYGQDTVIKKVVKK